VNEPQGLHTDEVASVFESRLPHLTDELVPNTHHFTIVLGEKVLKQLPGESDKPWTENRRVRSRRGERLRSLWSDVTRH
jgi:hypothetical protein